MSAPRFCGCGKRWRALSFRLLPFATCLEELVNCAQEDRDPSATVTVRPEGTIADTDTRKYDVVVPLFGIGNSVDKLLEFVLTYIRTYVRGYYHLKSWRLRPSKQ